MSQKTIEGGGTPTLDPEQEEDPSEGDEEAALLGLDPAGSVSLQNKHMRQRRRCFAHCLNGNFRIAFSSCAVIPLVS